MNQIQWAEYLSGMNTIRMAFSCTCQPNMNDVQPQMTRARTKSMDVFDLEECLIVSRLYRSHNLIKYLSYRLTSNVTMQGSIVVAVSKNVVIGVIVGNTMCSYSCTRPPVFDEDMFGDTFNAIDANLSAALYSAQKLGAQYA